MAMTNDRKARFAAGIKPIGLLSRGSEALSDKQSRELLEKLEQQPAAFRSWSESRILRESTVKSPLRQRVLIMIIELCILQNRVELESTVRALLDEELTQETRTRYERVHVAVLVKDELYPKAFETRKLVDYVAAVVQRDFFLCASIWKREEDLLVRKIMDHSVKQVAKHAIEVINRGIRPVGRPNAIAQVEQFAT